VGYNEVESTLGSMVPCLDSGERLQTCLKEGSMCNLSSLGEKKKGGDWSQSLLGGGWGGKGRHIGRVQTDVRKQVSGA